MSDHQYCVDALSETEESNTGVQCQVIIFSAATAPSVGECINSLVQVVPLFHAIICRLYHATRLMSNYVGGGGGVEVHMPPAPYAGYMPDKSKNSF